MPTMSKSSITTKRRASDLLPLVTPGEILRKEFMEPFALSINALAGSLGVPPNRIMQIIKNQRSITADTALRLSRYFGNSAEFWMNLQQHYELDSARREKLADIEQRVARRPPDREQAPPGKQPQSRVKRKSS